MSTTTFTKTDEQIEAVREALMNGDSNDEEIDGLNDIIDELLDDRERARSQIRANHAYTASVAGRPCECEWCVS